jgi:hypothetical protein
MVGKILKILAGLFLLIMLLVTSLLAEKKKTFPPAWPDSQKESDQNGPNAASSDPPIFSPIPPSRGKAGNLNPFLPPPLNIQEEPNTGG